MFRISNGWKRILGILRFRPRIKISERGGVSIVELAGPMQIGAGDIQLRYKVARLLQERYHPMVIFDLVGATYVDGAFVQELLIAADRVRNQGGIAVLAARMKTQKMLVILDMRHVGGCYLSVDEAFWGIVGQLVTELKQVA